MDQMFQNMVDLQRGFLEDNQELDKLHRERKPIQEFVGEQLDQITGRTSGDDDEPGTTDKPGPDTGAPEAAGGSTV